MLAFSFDEQESLLKIAIEILEDYNVQSWSFGGGTALSVLYYNHRMSYDIDIFSEDFSGITSLIENQKEIAANLGISTSQIQASPSGITFIISQEKHQLKLDFLYSQPLTRTPYVTKNILGQENIKVQTAFEIIAKKLKYRYILTIRDFVDFAYAENKDKIISKIKDSGILDIERFIDVWRQFDSISEEDFNLELQYLNPIFMTSKQCIYSSLFVAFNPKDYVDIAINEVNELLSFDSWIEELRDDYESIGEYNIYEKIPKNAIATILNKNSLVITYGDIYNLANEQVKELLKI
ncbi:nucleotidyl transferase AbiEii/AbiGii toxin family protein [Aliarcobacter butzleri]|uniref:nucleotidyl transferase AbiEii/AbiGii toxin family protein n=1 Tax=Aliarcobacter butzleri TaxID=28197 RepID=UPI00344CF76A